MWVFKLQKISEHNLKISHFIIGIIFIVVASVQGVRHYAELLQLQEPLEHQCECCAHQSQNIGHFDKVPQ